MIESFFPIVIFNKKPIFKLKKKRMYISNKFFGDVDLGASCQ